VGRQAVGVVGASGRAAVGSLLRAGFSAWAVDLFADRDLRRTAPCTRCPADDYPAALPKLTESVTPGPVLYTGGLENHPAVVGELAARRPLWGNPPEVLNAVRDPLRLCDILHRNGFGYPRVLAPGDPMPGDGCWLRKPLRSAGGLGIRFWRPDDERSASHYLQEFVDGPAMSAVYASTATRCVLLGVTEQLIGEPWLHALPFRYAGNIGPVAIDQALASELTLLGCRLVIGAGIRGLWGVDFILHHGRPFVVEVNPRYTAAAEVLEPADTASGLSWHAAAFGVGEFPPPAPTPSERVIGKAIYFAPRRLVFPQSGPWDADLRGDFDPWRLPAFADIPEPGEVIEPGHPVLTFFAAGSTADECRSRLQSTAAELDELFSCEAPSGAEATP
jgi:predicted ATP-grasp superfamily ATP-dependent carboligase